MLFTSLSQRSTAIPHNIASHSSSHFIMFVLSCFKSFLESHQRVFCRLRRPVYLSHETGSNVYISHWKYLNVQTSSWKEITITCQVSKSKVTVIPKSSEENICLEQMSSCIEGFYYIMIIIYRICSITGDRLRLLWIMDYFY